MCRSQQFSNKGHTKLFGTVCEELQLEHEVHCRGGAQADTLAVRGEEERGLSAALLNLRKR